MGLMPAETFLKLMDARSKLDKGGEMTDLMSEEQELIRTYGNDQMSGGTCGLCKPVPGSTDWHDEIAAQLEEHPILPKGIRRRG
jgi:hypothetical protein